MPAAKPAEFRRRAVELARRREQPIAQIARTGAPVLCRWAQHRDESSATPVAADCGFYRDTLGLRELGNPFGSGPQSVGSTFGSTGSGSIACRDGSSRAVAASQRRRHRCRRRSPGRRGSRPLRELTAAMRSSRWTVTRRFGSPARLPSFTESPSLTRLTSDNESPLNDPAA